MPLRVVDVSPHQNPKLIISTNKMGRYIALSYCWGPPGSDTFTLTGERLYDFTQGAIEEDRFTKTHQQAFSLARSLGIHYIWIDALCIIQDDRLDWLAQSQKMGEVYGSAYLTVVAGSSADTRRGFLQDRHTKIQPCPIPFDSVSPTAFLYATTFPSLDEGLTSTRGWCFQEGMLSKRAVVFGPEQISYRCAAGVVYEFKKRNNNSIVEAAQPFVRTLPIFRPEVQLRDMEAPQKHYAVLQHWYMMLRAFTGRGFTNPHDIYPSIAALAQRVAEYLQPGQQNYLAGIWEADIVRGLLWRPKYDGDEAVILKRPRCSTRRAPSWSWAAVHGRIDHLDLEAHRSVGIDSDNTAADWTPDGKWLQNSVFVTNAAFIRINPDAETAGLSSRAWINDPSDSNHFLEPTIKELYLTGRLTKAYFSSENVNIRQWRPRSDWRPIEQRGEQNLYDGRRPRFEGALSIYVHGRYLFEVENSKQKFGIGVFDVEDERCDVVWCLQMTEVEGLMLKAVDGEHSDESTDGMANWRFERLGLFWIEDVTIFDNVSQVEICLI